MAFDDVVQVSSKLGTSRSKDGLAVRISVGGLLFDPVSMREAVELIVFMGRARDASRYVCTGNLDHLVLAERDREFRDLYLGADLVLADGAPVVWLSRFGGPTAALPERVAGSDLFWELARASAMTGLRLFFLGGIPGAAEAASVAAERRHPGARIVGTYCPPHETFETPEEQARIHHVVVAAAPDVLLVAFGAPKQEKWIVANKDALGVPVAIGVGGAFEMAAGMRRRAPAWIQRIGLEWLYRFAQEPARLFPRYFVHDLPFFLRAAARAATSRLRRRESSRS